MKKGKVLKKQYYRIIFRLASPLMIGSGYNRYTDSDVLRNGKGIPYIPGSAVAGVCIHALEFDQKEREKYFGTWFDMKNQTQKGNNEKNVELEESKVLFYNADILKEDEEKYHVSTRDCVALDEWKVAKTGAKFDMEILEPNVKMVTYIEQNLFAGDNFILDQIAALWLNGNISFGAKTMRGFGAVEDVQIQRKTFDLDTEDAVKKWLEFDLYQESMWEKEPILQGKDLPSPKQKATKQLTLDLEQVGGISIRTYTTAVQKDANANPDSEQLLVHNKDGELVPVIPGTSWAGAFIHQMKRLGMKDEVKEAVFGKVDEKKKEKQKSRIRFSETQLSGAKEKIISRNAIDRFTGGTIDTALFTEKTYYGGTTQLKIELEESVDQTVKKTLAAAIVDLQNGFMAVGGLTAIGRGLFRVKKVNGQTLEWENPEQAYQKILEMLQTQQEKAV